MSASWEQVRCLQIELRITAKTYPSLHPQRGLEMTKNGSGAQSVKLASSTGLNITESQTEYKVLFVQPGKPSELLYRCNTPVPWNSKALDSHQRRKAMSYSLSIVNPTFLWYCIGPCRKINRCSECFRWWFYNISSAAIPFCQHYGRIEYWAWHPPASNYWLERWYSFSSHWLQ